MLCCTCYHSVWILSAGLESHNPAAFLLSQDLALAMIKDLNSLELTLIYKCLETISWQTIIKRGREWKISLKFDSNWERIDVSCYAEGLIRIFHFHEPFHFSNSIETLHFQIDPTTLPENFRGCAEGGIWHLTHSHYPAITCMASVRARCRLIYVENRKLGKMDLNVQIFVTFKRIIIRNKL